jgi:hypothetical protein
MDIEGYWMPRTTAMRTMPGPDIAVLCGPRENAPD